jgi:hypothetical protein
MNSCYMTQKYFETEVSKGHKCIMKKRYNQSEKKEITQIVQTEHQR